VNLYSEQASAVVGVIIGIVAVFAGWLTTLVTALVVASVWTVFQQQWGSPRYGVMCAAAAIVGIPLVLITDSIERANEGAKLKAFRKVMAKYAESPDEFAPRVEREEFNDELHELQQAFFRIEFDPTKDREEARTIIELYRSRIEDRYSGELPRILGNHVGAMYDEMTR